MTENPPQTLMRNLFGHDLGAWKREDTYSSESDGDGGSRVLGREERLMFSHCH
jgi:hypothetical protein